ncbi:MAG: hypothetical protein SPE19_05595, partial [Candidatus Faecousia sp.]|nr:hypothetical protein [Candidatus Faecousia sp.]
YRIHGLFMRLSEISGAFPWASECPDFALLWLFSYYLLCDNMELNKPVNRDLRRWKDLDKPGNSASR